MLEKTINTIFEIWHFCATRLEGKKTISILPYFEKKILPVFEKLAQILCYKQCVLFLQLLFTAVITH